MSSAGAFFVRWRVRMGYPLAIVVLFFARPVPGSILLGAAVGVVGVSLRACAAGHLHKQEVLTVTGPYAYTRNPLYLGSAILALGGAIATHSWISAIAMGVYFTLFYSVVILREEQELRLRHGAAFEQYVRAVPLFFPRWNAAKLSGASPGAFSYAQYKKNREWQAALGFLVFLAVLLLIRRLRLQ